MRVIWITGWFSPLYRDDSHMKRSRTRSHGMALASMGASFVEKDVLGVARIRSN